MLPLTVSFKIRDRNIWISADTSFQTTPRQTRKNWLR